METWFWAHYVARVIVEERIHPIKREPFLLSDFDLSWLKSLARNLTSLFL
ncbi:MAG TPA: hypothetical protein PKH77_17580 [Anaerolineae bacterium]|nr:hypothetical protein [Anaerolineae bacterium]